jgi:tRNA A58 N-methylase Trm61
MRHMVCLLIRPLFLMRYTVSTWQYIEEIVQATRKYYFWVSRIWEIAGRDEDSKERMTAVSSGRVCWN